MTGRKITIAWLCILLSNLLNAQQITINIGKKEIALNEYFQITLTVQNEGIKTKSEFPNITGFVKEDVSTQQSYNNVNGRSSSSLSLVQNYRPTKEGTFSLSPFKMKVNGKAVSSNGAQIKVGPKKYQQRRDPFDDFFSNRRQSSSSQKEYKDVKDNAYLSVKVNKRRVFRGEGFLASISFFATKNDIQVLQFKDDINVQYSKMIKSIKVKDAWIEDIEKEISLNNWQPVTIGNKQYYQLDLGDVIIFPQENGKLKIPSLSLNMIRYKVANSQDFFGRTVQVKGDGEERLYQSKPVSINVKTLPPHPLRDQVPVGSYRLIETISDEELKQNESFVYEYKVSGKGNINFVPEPTIEKNSGLNFYKPAVLKKIKKDKGYVSGFKRFTYDVVAEKSGTYKLNELINFIFFDPAKGKYDTLRSKKTIRIAPAENLVNANLTNTTTPNDAGFAITQSDSSIWSTNGRDFLKIYVNALIFLMFVAIGIIIWKSKKAHG